MNLANVPGPESRLVIAWPGRINFRAPARENGPLQIRLADGGKDRVVFGVSANAPGTIDLRVFTVAGREIWARGLSAVNPGFHRLAWNPIPGPGIFFAAVEDGANRAVARFVVP
jgi:hypothetical protein